MPDSAKRLRSLIERYYDNVPEEFDTVFNYISKRELWKFHNHEIDVKTKEGLAALKRLIKASEYWLRKGFPDREGYIKKHTKRVKDNIEASFYSSVVPSALIIAKIMLEEMGVLW